MRRELNAQLDAKLSLVSLLARQRQNFALKVIALVASILLYFYVQQERNPVLQRTLFAAIVTQDAPPDMELELEKPNVLVAVSGPTDVVERLTDQNVHAVANLNGMNVARDFTKPQLVRARYEISGLDKQTAAKLTFEPTEPLVKVQLFASATRQLAVHPVYPKDAPAGYYYGLPDLKPVSVKVIGRSDRVARVEQLIIEGAPSESGAQIEGDFPVVAHDKEDNPVQGVTLDPPTVHLSVRLMERPPSQIVTVSAITQGLPLPPNLLGKISVIPARVRIVGRPDALANTSTIETEVIPLADLTQTQEITAHLILPSNVSVRDMNNRLIDQVKVRIEIQQAPAPAVPPKTDGKPAPADPAKTKKADGK